MLKSLPGLTVYDSLKQRLLALEGYVVKRKIMSPVVLKNFKKSHNRLNLKAMLVCKSEIIICLKNQLVKATRNIMVLSVWSQNL